MREHLFVNYLRNQWPGRKEIGYIEIGKRIKSCRNGLHIINGYPTMNLSKTVKTITYNYGVEIAY